MSAYEINHRFALLNVIAKCSHFHAGANGAHVPNITRPLSRTSARLKGAGIISANDRLQRPEDRILPVFPDQRISGLRPAKSRAMHRRLLLLQWLLLLRWRLLRAINLEGPHTAVLRHKYSGRVYMIQIPSKGDRPIGCSTEVDNSR